MSSSTSTSKARHFAGWTAGALTAVFVLLLAAEFVLRLLPAGGGLHRENPRSAASSARLVRNQRYTFSMGWDLRHVVRGRTNSAGFISPYEYRDQPGVIALLGDSFAEGEMLAYDESLAGHLESQSGGRLRAYNFGLAGAALPHYLGIAREVGRELNFAAAVVIVGAGDYSEGFLEQEGLYKWARVGNQAGELIDLVPAAHRSLLVRLARESALVHYLRENLKFSPSRFFARTGPKACLPQRLGAADTARLAAYADELPRALRLAPARVVMVFNTNTRHIYEQVDAGAAEPCADLDTLALKELRVLAAARGMKVLEAAPLLEEHYRTHHRPLDFRPVDPHWNGLATSLIAAQVRRVLDEDVHPAAALLMTGDHPLPVSAVLSTTVAIPAELSFAWALVLVAALAAGMLLRRR